MTVPATVRPSRPLSPGTAAAHRAHIPAALAVALLAAVALAPSAALAANEPGDPGAAADEPPSVQYEEAVAHAGDRIAFSAGDRVTVPFTPRNADRWAIDGMRPVELPAGRASGRAIRESEPGQAESELSARQPAGPRPGAAVGAADLPYVDPASNVFAGLAAAVDPGGLKREVFGWLPYWEVSDSSTRLDWEKLSTIAYFGVGAAGNGSLQRRNSDGSTTVGWSGWTSSKMTSVINAAHANGTRVVLTVQSFAWSSAGVTRQKQLLGSAANRANLARQIAAAVRDRGADGVNLDFEPIVSTYSDEFTALVRSIRAELDKVHRGYQVTFAAMAGVSNYPLENATASGGADAVVIMGYDYRTASSKVVGSVAPVGGPTFDVTDTVRAFLNRIPASKVILAVPYYGRAWSTDTGALHARNISGTKYGASVTVVYGNARDYVAHYGRHWDATEGVAWTAYHRQNCTAAYGCVNPWRQLYYDDAQALGLKYDVINRYNLRGAGIWALGYDGTRTELYQMLKDKFITDRVPPTITGQRLTSSVISPNGDRRLDSTTIGLTATGYVRFGWAVQPYVGGVPGRSIRSGGLLGKTVTFTWDGKDAAGTVVRDGPYVLTLWVADASNNRAAITKRIIVDRRPASVGLGSAPSFISPDGDGHSDSTVLSMTSDEAFSGRATLMNKAGATIRTWSFTRVRSARWTWNGRDRDGRIVPDGQYTLRVAGIDPAANPTVRTLGINVDRTIRSVTWRSSAFTPRAGQKDRVTVVIGRHARLSAGIYHGSTLIRQVWTNQPVDAGTYGWTWDGRTSTGAFAAPGTYSVVVRASSAIGGSWFGRTVVVRAP
jgi:spore germination protein YaaH/flagellar hook assembly protein FlgD